MSTLKVPCATLHYDVRGTGPVLLLIPGGPMDGGGFAAVAAPLSQRYTVVTYDPRGLSRSTFDDGEPQDTTVETFADDAHRLLAALSPDPAYVLGDSGGGLVGFELLARHPEQVRVLVAHEPPLTKLLGDAEEQAAFDREVYETYRTQGVGPAMAMFLAEAGLDGDAPQPPPDPTPEMAEAMAAMGRNLDFFLGHMWLPLGDYLPDLDRLRSLPVVVAVGEGSEGQLAHRAALAVAERLGQEPVVLPGAHSGMGSDPQTFARGLSNLLSGRS